MFNSKCYTRIPLTTTVISDGVIGIFVEINIPVTLCLWG